MLTSLVVAAAHAQTVTVDLDAAKAQALGLDPADLEGQLNGLIADQLNTGDVDAYMAKYANASAMAIKGMGVDYASNFKKFVVGGSFGPAVSGVPFSLSRGPEAMPEGGFAFMAAAHAGVNLGVLTPTVKKSPLSHVRLFVNGMAFNPPANREFQASMYNVGGHAQISLGGAKLSPLAQWGGIAFTGGYELSSYELSLAQELPLEQQVDPATVTWTANGTYDLRATSTTIPLEVSTNVRIAIVSAYAGGGFDLNTGDATSNASLSGPIDARAQGVSDTIGSASVSLAGLGSADPQVGRLFGGAQLNLSYFKVYGQLNYGFNSTYGAFLGARFAM
jgi:hypothetical protein